MSAKKIISVCLILALVICVVPVSVSANDVTDLTGTVWLFDDEVNPPSSWIYGVIEGVMSYGSYSVTLPYVSGSYTYDSYSAMDKVFNSASPLFVFGSYGSGNTQKNKCFFYFSSSYSGSLVSSSGWYYSAGGKYYKIGAPILFITGGAAATDSVFISWLSNNARRISSSTWIDGIWEANSSSPTVTDSVIEYVNFTSGGVQYDKIQYGYVEATGNLRAKHNLIYSSDSKSLQVRGDGWFYASGKVIDFGTEPQLVSLEFYTWLTDHFTRIGDSPQNGNTVNLKVYDYSGMNLLYSLDVELPVTVEMVSDALTMNGLYFMANEMGDLIHLGGINFGLAVTDPVITGFALRHYGYPAQLDANGRYVLNDVAEIFVMFEGDTFSGPIDITDPAFDGFKVYDYGGVNELGSYIGNAPFFLELIQDTASGTSTLNIWDNSYEPGLDDNILLYRLTYDRTAGEPLITGVALSRWGEPIEFNDIGVAGLYAGSDLYLLLDDDFYNDGRDPNFNGVDGDTLLYNYSGSKLLETLAGLFPVTIAVKEDGFHILDYAEDVSSWQVLASEYTTGTFVGLSLSPGSDQVEYGPGSTFTLDSPGAIYLVTQEDLDDTGQDPGGSGDNTGDDSGDNNGGGVSDEALGDIQDGINGTNDKLDDLISGGQAGDNLSGSNDALGDVGDQLGDIVGDANDASGQLPGFSDDLGDILSDNLTNFYDSPVLGLMPWNDDEYSFMWDIILAPTLTVMSVSLLLYFVFGKANVK